MQKFMKISVVIPVYKVEQYLRQCVDSVLGQSYRDLEVILVDDGSPDRSGEMCDEIALSDSRVRVIHKPNGGLSDARNAGVAVATGRYVTFVDSDDYWGDTEAMARVAATIERWPGVDMVIAGYTQVWDDGCREPRSTSVSAKEVDGRTMAEVLGYMSDKGDFFISAWQKVVRRELLEGVAFEKGLYSEDIDWTLQLYDGRVRSVAAVERPYYIYRQRSGSITATLGEKNYSDLLWIVDKWSRRLAPAEGESVERALLRGYVGYVVFMLMGLLGRADAGVRRRMLPELKRHGALMAESGHSKARKAYAAYRLLGAALSSRLMGLYLKLRYM